MTGFEPRTSGIGSDCSTNWATTTAHYHPLFNIYFEKAKIKIEKEAEMAHFKSIQM